VHRKNILIQGAYKLSEDFAKPSFFIFFTEILDVTTIWKKNVCSFTVILNAFDVRPTCDTADDQAILPFPPNPHKHVLCDVPDGSSDYRTISNVTFTVCNQHEFHDLATLPTQVMAKRNLPIIYTHSVTQLIYLETALHVAVVPPPVIRSANNCIYSIWFLSHRYCYLPLSWKSWNWYECAVGGDATHSFMKKFMKKFLRNGGINIPNYTLSRVCRPWSHLSPPREPQISYKLRHRPIMYLWSFRLVYDVVTIRKIEQIMTTRHWVIRRVRGKGHSRILKYCPKIRLQDVRKNQEQFIDSR
jgi:hypothetical protein